MNLLIVGTKKLPGGGSIASCNLFRHLSGKGFNIYFFDSSSGYLYYQDFLSPIHKFKPSLFNFTFSISFRALVKLFKISSLFPPVPVSLGILGIYNLKQVIDYVSPSIVNIHWLGNDLVSIRDLSNITVPVVLTLHDFWPLSGLRHIIFPDSQHLRDPYADYPMFNRLDAFFKYIKVQELLSIQNLCAIVSPSKFVDSYVCSFLNHHSFDVAHSIIPNIVNPFSLTILESRSNHISNTPSSSNQINILYGGSGNASPLIKGYHYFAKILQSINSYQANDSLINVMLLGSAINFFSAKQRSLLSNISFQDLGFDINISSISDTIDIYCSTSPAETFGLMAVEMASAGVESIAFAGMGTDYILENFHCPNLHLIPDFSITLYAKRLQYLIKLKTSNSCLESLLPSQLPCNHNLESIFPEFDVHLMNSSTVDSYIDLFNLYS